MSECSHPSRRIVGGAVLACALAGILAGALELAWMRAMWQPSMAVAGGLPKTVPPILGLSVLACTIVGAVQGLTAWLFHRIARVLAKGPSSHPRWLAALCTVAMTPAISWACAQAFSGRRARMLPGRWLWITAAGVVLLGVTYGGVRVVLGVGKRLEQAGGKGRGSSLGAWLAGGLVLAGAMFLALDQRLLVHRYPFFHVALEVLTFLACELAVLAAVNAWPRWRKDRHRILTRGWLASTAFLAVSAGALSIGTLRSSDALALRALVYEHGSLSARFLDGARLLGVSMDGAPLLNPSNQEGPVARRVTGDFPRFPGADLVLITVDALRADHLGALGYGRGVSPNLDQLAQASAVFERAYAPVPHTSFSIASLLVGKHVHALARLGLMNGHESLADVLRRYRYKTAAFFPPAVFYVDGERFKAYEEQRYGFEYVRFEPFLEDEDATARTDQAIRFLETERPVRTFLWIHYFGPHEPYVLHPNLGWSTNGERAVDNYDGEIRWVDREIGRLLDYLRANRPRAIIAVTADHGEEFGDHGGAYHGTTLYDEQLRVPLILHVPGLPGRRVGSPVSTVDVFPTLLSLVDVPVSARARGTDLRPWLVPKNPEPEADLPPVFAEIDALKMVALGSEKLICDATRGFCRLFDLHIDPKETRDLARERPQRALELRAHLGTWMASHAGFERAAMDADPAQAARRAVLSRGQLGDREAVPSLVDVLVGKDVPRDDRLLAARAVAVLAVESAMASGPALGEPELTSLRRARPADPDPSVRAWINVALAVSGAADARAALEHLDPMVIADEPELPARAALARHAAGDKGVVPALLAARARAEDVNLKRDLILALGRARDPSAKAALIDAYEGVRTRKYAAIALGNLGDRSVVPFLTARLGNETYMSVRVAIARALGQLGDRRALVHLKRAFSSEPEEQVVAACAGALASLGEGLPVRPGVPIRPPPRVAKLWLVPQGNAPTPIVVTRTPTLGPRDESRLEAPAYGDALAVPVVDGTATLASSVSGRAFFR